MRGEACGDCGWEWIGKAPVPMGPCGAHIGGRPCTTPGAFAEAKLHYTAGCNHAAGDCKVTPVDAAAGPN